jgi:hypothetical protein
MPIPNQILCGLVGMTCGPQRMQTELYTSLNRETEYIGQLFALINGNFAQIMFLADYYYLL